MNHFEEFPAIETIPPPQPDGKWYYMYKIYNEITDFYYLGRHETDDLDDGYFGSGKYLNKDIEELWQSREYFRKIFIGFYQNFEELWKTEEKIINGEFVKRDDVYNISLGGFGGWHHAHTEEIFKKISTSMKCSEKAKKHRKNLKPFQKGHKPWNAGLTGVVWNYRIPVQLDVRDKISKTMKDGYATGRILRTNSYKTLTDTERVLRRKKNSEAHKGQIPWNVGIRNTEEQNKKISIKGIERWERWRKEKRRLAGLEPAASL